MSTLENLSWGELFFPYQVRLELIHPMMASKQFPMTFEEIRSGMVKGPQRIVTMNSGVYGWPASEELHLIHKFDSRGAPAVHGFLTTVESASVRSCPAFAEHESAVIEPIPVTLQAASPVNARVLAYEDQKAPVASPRRLQSRTINVRGRRSCSQDSSLGTGHRRRRAVSRHC